MPERESTLRTLGIAGGVALVCSLAVSSAVSWLQPFQLAYRSIEENRAIVAAAGLGGDDVHVDVGVAVFFVDAFELVVQLLQSGRALLFARGSRRFVGNLALDACLR